MRTLGVLPALLAVLGCATPLPQPPNLNPSDPRPLHAVAVEDAAEVDILVQTVGVQLVRVADGTLFFVARPGALDQLAAAGYLPRSADRMDVEQRVVRAYGGTEEEVLRTGVRLINREREYRVVVGSLAQLRTVERIGVRLTEPGFNEPVPRRVRITVPAPADVERAAALADMHGARPEGRQWVVEAEAFDGQIDALRAAGYHVEQVFSSGRTP